MAYLGYMISIWLITGETNLDNLAAVESFSFYHFKVTNFHTLFPLEMVSPAHAQGEEN